MQGTVPNTVPCRFSSKNLKHLQHLLIEPELGVLQLPADIFQFLADLDALGAAALAFAAADEIRSYDKQRD